MTISKLTLAAAALALSSGAAFAASAVHPQANHKHQTLMDVSMNRSVDETRTTVFGLPASEPTIFGHRVVRSTLPYDDDSAR